MRARVEKVDVLGWNKSTVLSTDYSRISISDPTKGSSISYVPKATDAGSILV